MFFFLLSSLHWSKQMVKRSIIFPVLFFPIHLLFLFLFVLIQPLLVVSEWVVYLVAIAVSEPPASCYSVLLSICWALMNCSGRESGDPHSQPYKVHRQSPVSLSWRTLSALFSRVNYLADVLRLYPAEQRAGLCPWAANKPFIKL